MKLIVGLGNPGDKYSGTRHNAGFSVISELSDRWDIAVKTKEAKGLSGKGIYRGEKVILLKPQTFMNNSGESVALAAAYYHIKPQDIILIYDDIYLTPGRLRIRKKGSAGGHNGMKSVIAGLGSEEFPRVRVGVGEKPEGYDLAAWVLSRFPKELLDDMRRGTENAARAVETILTEGCDAAMNLFNGI